MKISQEAINAHARMLSLAGRDLGSPSIRMSVAAYPVSSIEEVDSYEDKSVKTAGQNKYIMESVARVNEINASNLCLAITAAVLDVAAKVTVLEPHIRNYEFAIGNRYAFILDNNIYYRSYDVYDLRAAVAPWLTRDLMSSTIDLVLDSGNSYHILCDPWYKRRKSIFLDEKNGYVDVAWLQIAEQTYGVKYLRVTHNVKSEIRMLDRDSDGRVSTRSPPDRLLAKITSIYDY